MVTDAIFGARSATEVRRHGLPPDQQRKTGPQSRTPIPLLNDRLNLNVNTPSASRLSTIPQDPLKPATLNFIWGSGDGDPTDD